MDHTEQETLEVGSIVDILVVESIGLASVVLELSDLALYWVENHQTHFVYSSLNDLHMNLSCYIISLCELLLCGLV
ncbi:hypothetical protein [Neobacillus drentensis]|uniref:hypothetical protein n=1 Tax=Neobacillus drentensis TaxID=220684 RepID=UPI002FFF0C5F